VHTHPPRLDVAFVAAHLLAPALSSGGDVLFANVAREIARMQPDWHVGVVAPDYARDALRPFFRTVVPLPSAPGEAERVATHPRRVLSAWASRTGPLLDILTALQPRVVHTTGDFFVDVLPSARLRRRAGSRWSGVVHHLNAPPLRRRNELVASTASYVLQRVSLRAMRRSCDAVSLLNTTTLEELAALGFRRDRLHVVGAGIDAGRFRLVPEPPPGRRILWVHRLEPTKGVADLPKLAALLPGAQFDVVGRGPQHWQSALERDLAAAGVASRVRLHGFVGDDELLALYASANAFVSCSYEEGFGISLCEALASGVPCVAYGLPSHAEIFGDLVACVPPGDVEALARRIEAVLASTGGDAARARRSAGVARHSFVAVAERQAQIFAKLLADAGGGVSGSSAGSSTPA